MFNKSSFSLLEVYLKRKGGCFFCYALFALLKVDNILPDAYHWFPEELVLGVVFAENEPRVTFKRPGRLNLPHNLVVLQTSLCDDKRTRVWKHFTKTFYIIQPLHFCSVLPRPRVGWNSRRAQFSWSLQWAVWTNMWHTSLAVAPGETHTDLLWLSPPYTFNIWWEHERRGRNISL